MVNNDSFEGTAAWLRGQWSNPSDIFTILLIIGGDAVQVAIAQLCAGPVPYFTPVSFSFGWVTYAVSAMLSAVGENRLMPKPELECMLINARSGYARSNKSWVLSRMLRDFDHWRPAECNKVEAEKLADLRSANERLRNEHFAKLAKGEKSKEPPESADLRIGLRVTIWQCISATDHGDGDVVYWIGTVVTFVQLGLAAIPWGLYGEWFSFFVTAVGTMLAYASSSLPQWRDEKLGVRRLKYTDDIQETKDVVLTEGNGAHDAILILGCEGGLDLEALAAPQRDLPHAWSTRIASLVLATLWIALLVTVAGWKSHTWYILGVGMIGILHNVIVAGVKRQPKAFGIDLTYQETVVDGKVMIVLSLVEQKYPGVGAALLKEFFPGKLLSRETAFWKYAERRAKAFTKRHASDKDQGTSEAWLLPPLRRPPGHQDDSDIPQDGPYHPP